MFNTFGPFFDVLHNAHVLNQKRLHINKIIYQIILYCDLHGHSRKHMVFMYGCERKAYYQPPKSKKQNGEKLVEKQPTEKSTDPLNETRDFVEERMFPWLMHKLAPNR